MSKTTSHETQAADLTQAEYASGDDDNMFAEGEHRSDDGSIWVPKITMTSIRALPDRCKQQNNGHGGPMRIAILSGLATGTDNFTKPDTGEVFVGLIGEFGAIVFDNDGEPTRIYKSDTLFFPIGQQAALAALNRRGVLQFSYEFSSQPSGSPAGYSWSYRNLAKIDRRNLDPIDRLLSLSVAASRHQALAGPNVGLLADLRTTPTPS